MNKLDLEAMTLRELFEHGLEVVEASPQVKPKTLKELKDLLRTIESDSKVPKYRETALEAGLKVFGKFWEFFVHSVPRKEQDEHLIQALEQLCCRAAELFKKEFPYRDFKKIVEARELFKKSHIHKNAMFNAFLMRAEAIKGKSLSMEEEAACVRDFRTTLLLYELLSAGRSYNHMYSFVDKCISSFKDFGG